MSQTRKLGKEEFVDLCMAYQYKKQRKVYWDLQNIKSESVTREKRKKHKMKG